MKKLMVAVVVAVVLAGGWVLFRGREGGPNGEDADVETRTVEVRDSIVEEVRVGRVDVRGPHAGCVRLHAPHAQSGERVRRECDVLAVYPQRQDILRIVDRLEYPRRGVPARIEHVEPLGHRVLSPDDEAVVDVEVRDADCARNPV